MFQVRFRLGCNAPAIIAVNQPTGKLTCPPANTINAQDVIEQRTKHRHQPDQPGPGRRRTGILLILSDMHRHRHRQPDTNGRRHIGPIGVQHRQ